MKPKKKRSKANKLTTCKTVMITLRLKKAELLALKKRASVFADENGEFGNVSAWLRFAALNN